MNSFKKLTEKTLTMEDPRLIFHPKEQSQEIPVSSSEEDINDLAENNQESKETKKAKISLSRRLMNKKKV